MLRGWDPDGGVAMHDVTVLDMEVDEALKMIISLGVVVPPWRKDPAAQLALEVGQKPEKTAE